MSVVPSESAPQASAPPRPRGRSLRSRWEQLPLANRQRLLHLLGRLVERQLSAAPQRAASSEEAEHDLHR